MTADPPAHPPHPGTEDDPPPPLREQLPLPRRSQQAHLEPQLRVPSSGGEGTPFAPFEGAVPDPAPLPVTPGEAPAAFRAGTTRGRADRAGGTARKRSVDGRFRSDRS